MLTFETRDESDQTPTRFTLTLLNTTTADLAITNAPVKIKPIRFEKGKPTA